MNQPTNFSSPVLKTAAKTSSEKRKPDEQGLYNQKNDHDACGIGFVANMKNKKSHQIIKNGLVILEKLEHRGAVGADPKAGDGCGILIQMPHDFMTAMAGDLGFALPQAGSYAVAHIFMPKDQGLQQQVRDVFEESISQHGHHLLGWRAVPVDNSDLGYSVLPTEPDHFHLFIRRGAECPGEDEFERSLFVMRRIAELRLAKMAEDNEALGDFYVPSMSCRTLLYKGMLLSTQIGAYFKDLTDERMTSALALVHQRFSTNTFPTWSLAHPFRMICHNGEINTVRGNVNWMAARQATMKSSVLGDDLEKIWPLLPEGQSDSAYFDNALELLVQGGYSMAHAMMVLIPEAWGKNPLMDQERRAFYEYHAAVMEPWDGPAAVAFTDGRQIGATLDRNGLRPARYLVTDDDMIMLASEMGVLPVPEEKIITKWRLQPGKMLLVDLEEGRIISDEEVKAQVSALHPYQDWLSQSQIKIDELPDSMFEQKKSKIDLLDLQQTFGVTQEVVKMLMLPMLSSGMEAIGSMGTDTPVSALSDKSKLLHTYFKQNFAQVTNPPIDPIREELVMSLVSFVGPRPNLLDPEHGAVDKRLEVSQPVLSNDQLNKIREIGEIGDNHFQTKTLDITYDAKRGEEGMAQAVEDLCHKAERSLFEDNNIIILSDRLVSAKRIPIPSLLATAAVHHHLVRKGLRTSVGLVVETGEAAEVNQFCTLAAYGAEAINPYVAFDILENLKGRELEDGLTHEQALDNYIKAVGKGIKKVMSKMGISTYHSYCGAQIYDAVGLSQGFIDKYFTGTQTQIEGVGLSQIAAETCKRHYLAFSGDPVLAKMLDVGGDYAQRVRGERHGWHTDTVSLLQHAVRGNAEEKYRAYAKEVNDQSEALMTLRGMFRIRGGSEMGRKPVPIDSVESAAEIVKRFATGAMSYGSISREAHTTLAIAMNRIGAKSNTGEGGEETDRFQPLPNGDLERSAIKQVASGRFGVTTEYLVNADMIQIKIIQGAKPGEGGQLPGHKVNSVIAKVRYSTPGVGLISPPPHHDIYSIEDLAQLIYDLKSVNPAADISVKLGSEIGVGTVAAGVSKSMADHVTIAGYDGGTGASPLTSIKHAGSPWEIGLAETQQTLVSNDLRTRITVQVDGGFKTGRDVIVGALLGADEFGFATAPLIAAGCVMMRKCHLNTCPVGIATQDPELRRRFTGKPEHVVNYFFFVAQEVRELMAEMGFTRFDEMIGQAAYLEKDRAIDHWKANGLDFSKLLHAVEPVDGHDLFNSGRQQHNFDDTLDRKLIGLAREALDSQKSVKIELPIENTDRTTGATLSGEVAKKYGHKGLPDETIHITLNGTSGQSFGAWVSRGITLDLVGEGNDYVGKGLSGGRLIIRPPANSKIVPEKSIIVGNTVLYGAISGECYFRGVAGERFGVRNSGAYAVVEGTGDHCCEYMTGGVVVVLGETGRNFAAGMSGGIAYVFDAIGDFDKRCNKAQVELGALAKGEVATGNSAEVSLSDVMVDMTGQDEERLHMLVSNHMRYTDSQVARNILENWQEMLPKFIKVMPTDYRRALEELSLQDADDDMMEGMEEGNG